MPLPQQGLSIETLPPGSKMTYCRRLRLPELGFQARTFAQVLELAQALGLAQIQRLTQIQILTQVRRLARILGQAQIQTASQISISVDV